MDVREKLVELPIEDALLILREEHRQRTDSYTTYLAHGGKGDPAEEVGLDALAMAISALEKQSGFRLRIGCRSRGNKFLFIHGMISANRRSILGFRGNGGSLGTIKCLMLIASPTGCRCQIHRKENNYGTAL